MLFSGGNRGVMNPGAPEVQRGLAQRATRLCNQIDRGGMVASWRHTFWCGRLSQEHGYCRLEL